MSQFVVKVLHLLAIFNSLGNNLFDNCPATNAMALFLSRDYLIDNIINHPHRRHHHLC